jgi:putative transcriptional regulator
MDYLKIPKQATEGKLSAGTMLIAEPFLTETHFSRSVICLCEHGNDGTVGFIINKATQFSLCDLLESDTTKDLPVYTGGPVQTDTLHMLHRMPDVLGGNKIAEDVYWGGSFEVLQLLVEKGDLNDNDIHLFLGYAGWSAGQLNDELKQGSWLIGACNSHIIFDTQDDDKWKAAILSLGDDYRHIINMPLHPQNN